MNKHIDTCTKYSDSVSLRKPTYDGNHPDHHVRVKGDPHTRHKEGNNKPVAPVTLPCIRYSDIHEDDQGQ